ncbi:MAG: alpha/beta hydrolase [Bacteroidales bacterium]|nr:alpha/beta hydrolase [Bacteroidales bacterium]MBQ9529006.1 alpha/beta hydrolase [Bacteroidales bacterium]
MKRLMQFAALVVAAFCLTSCMAGKFMSKYALQPAQHGVEDIDRCRAKADSLMPGSTKWYDDLKAEGVLRDTFITGYRDFRIHACYVPAKEPAKAKGTAIVVHGYTDNHLVFLYLVRMYRDDFNYNVLFPDLQYFGYSEGDHAQMGWYDRLDVEKWIEVAHGIFNDDFMVLHGVSMGAATVMMAGGDPLPEYVRCIVEDCGYSSVVMQFNDNRKQSFRFISPDVLQSASLVTRRRYGWGFWEASSAKQLEKCTIPVFFIHGDADDFVPIDHLWRNFNAKKQGYKEYWVAPGAVHANSYAKYPEEYKARVKDFLNRVHGLMKKK